MTGIGMGTDNNTRQQKWQQHMMRGTTRTGEEWKVQAMDPAPYNEECKKGPRDINISWAVGKFFLFHFIFLSLTKFLVINYWQQLPGLAENREGHQETHGGETCQVSTSQPPSQCHITDTRHLPPTQNINPAPTSSLMKNCSYGGLWVQLG